MGMGKGWPARQAGTKLSVVIDGDLHALEPPTSSDGGKTKIYDPQEDIWKVAVSQVFGDFAGKSVLACRISWEAPFGHQGCG